MAVEVIDKLKIKNNADRPVVDAANVDGLIERVIAGSPDGFPLEEAFDTNGAPIPGRRLYYLPSGVQGSNSLPEIPRVLQLVYLYEDPMNPGTTVRFYVEAPIVVKGTPGAAAITDNLVTSMRTSFATPVVSSGNPTQVTYTVAVEVDYLGAEGRLSGSTNVNNVALVEEEAEGIEVTIVDDLFEYIPRVLLVISKSSGDAQPVLINGVDVVGVELVSGRFSVPGDSGTKQVVEISRVLRADEPAPGSLPLYLVRL